MRLEPGANMRVGNVMTREIEGIDISASATEAAQKMKLLGVGVLPVFDNGRVAGVVTDRDLVVRVLADPGGARWTPIVRAMTEHTVTIGPDADMDSAIKLMSDKGVSRLMVEDSNGTLVGILSIADIEAEGLSDWATELHRTLGAKYRERHMRHVTRYAR